MRLLQVLTDFAPKSPIGSSIHWISNGQHQDRAYADVILDGLASMRSNLEPSALRLAVQKRPLEVNSPRCTTTRAHAPRGYCHRYAFREIANACFKSGCL